MPTRYSKREFYDKLAHTLAQDGWTRLSGAADVAALFGRRVDDLILNLGFTESNRYNDRITADFALGRHTYVTMAFPDAPRARQRVGIFLLPEERSRILDPEFTRSGVVDAWWVGRTDETIEKVADAIRVALPRFLGQEGLVDEVRRSRSHAEHTRRLARITDTPFTKSTSSTPPEEWVEAAERLLADTPSKIRAVFARKIAADAWRTYNLLRQAT